MCPITTWNGRQRPSGDWNEAGGLSPVFQSQTSAIVTNQSAYPGDLMSMRLGPGHTFINDLQTLKRLRPNAFRSDPGMGSHIPPTVSMAAYGTTRMLAPVSFDRNAGASFASKMHPDMQGRGLLGFVNHVGSRGVLPPQTKTKSLSLAAARGILLLSDDSAQTGTSTAPIAVPPKIFADDTQAAAGVNVAAERKPNLGSLEAKVEGDASAESPRPARMDLQNLMGR